LSEDWQHLAVTAGFYDHARAVVIAGLQDVELPGLFTANAIALDKRRRRCDQEIHEQGNMVLCDTHRASQVKNIRASGGGVAEVLGALLCTGKAQTKSAQVRVAA